MWDNERSPIAPPDMDISYSISDVERETGITREILRIWERRYGFPAPGRSPQGDRAYSRADVDTLRQVRKLMDAGMRPGKIFAQGLHTQHGLLAERSQPDQAPERLALINTLKRHDTTRLDHWLRERLNNDLGLFIRTDAGRFCHWVGEAWLNGELEIFEEHLFSERLEAMLKQALPPLTSGTEPHVLLTTASGELHSLGLLMSECLFHLAGCRTTSLGTNTPLNDIARAARQMRCDIVALSFSGAYPHAQAKADLLRLRDLLPADCQLWAGGRAVSRLRIRHAGLMMMDSLDELAPAVQQWRQQRPPAGP